VCDNLVKIYRVAELEVFALQGLDLQVAQGEMLAIVGASGSGKSSLLNILGGLDRPTAGRVLVNGQDLFKMRDSRLDEYRRHQVGFIWQQGSRNLVPYLTAAENIALPMRLAGQPAAAAQERANELLEVVGLVDRRNHTLSQMSGGEQQRVAIAVALINHPPLLLADEPTGELDSATAKTIYAAFHNISQRFGFTTIIVSHDPGIAHQVDRVVAVRDGKLASESVRAERSAAGSGETEIIEVAVLDSAGRVQLPREYLAAHGMNRRVRLELTGEGIMVRPTSEGGIQPGEAGSLPQALPGKQTGESLSPLEGTDASKDGKVWRWIGSYVMRQARRILRWRRRP
jgi:ABC-type lipoprotein export system ATPase subunit